MEPNPGRVAEYSGEAAAAGDIGEVGDPGEWHGAAAPYRAEGSGERAAALAFGGEALSGDGCGGRSRSEEVACAEGGEDVASSCGAGGELALEMSDDERAFGA